MLSLIVVQHKFYKDTFEDYFVPWEEILDILDLHY